MPDTAATVALGWPEQLLALLVLLACVAAMVWMLLGQARQQRLRHGWLQWRQRRRAPRKPAPDPTAARREAQALIERARRTPAVQREGNVLRPERFARRGGTEDPPSDQDDEPPRPTLH